MRYLYLLSFCFLCCFCLQCKQVTTTPVVTPSSLLESTQDTITKDISIAIHAITHASVVLQGKENTLYIDPTGAYDHYKEYPKPNFILITDIHGDHLAIETLDSLFTPTTKIIAPAAVAELLPASYTHQLIILNNNETKTIGNIIFEAIPMYNLREDALHFHEKGRGNGYVITMEDTRVYISGDTEDIPEMRTLKNIDIAFVCMNLPWTMTVSQAADAVLDFTPTYIYPYHYKGKDGFSDIGQFKTLVAAKNPEIQVVQLDWYP